MDSSLWFSIIFLTLLISFLPKPSEVQATDLSVDRRALLSFKSLLDDPDDVLSSWNDDTDVCNFAGEIPVPLFNFSNLRTFAVGFNQLEGTLPSDFGRNLPSLGYLYLYNNRFEGPIPPTIINSSSLELVELHNNNFSGVIPPNLGELQNLTKLSLSYNKFVAKDVHEWAFMDSLTRCSILAEIDLNANNLSGVLPNSIANLSTSLEWLRIRDNNISGEIPGNIGRLIGLVTIDFSMNQLIGSIPSSLGRIKGLMAFIVTSNKLSGEIPSSLGNLENMLEFYLGDNHFVGNVPSSLASLKKLIVLDLARNNLNGSIPKGLLRISSIALFFNVSRNQLTGELPSEVGLLKNLKSFDASENKFHGQIPESLGQCQQLEYLNLQGNNFSSEIPDELKELKGVHVLDLSRNNLSGSIPDFFETSWVDTIQYLNLSFNKLEKEVPTKGIFSNISLYSVEGNEGLCGGNLDLNLKSCDDGDKTQSKKLTTSIIVTIVSIMVVLVFLCVIFIAYRFSSRTRKNKSFIILPPNDGQILQLSYTEIKRATNSFSPTNIIGSGGYGTVYKGTLQDVVNNNIKEIAVKILDQHQIRAASKSFNIECEVLRTVRHRNLVKILTACSMVDDNGNDFKALVYEFMQNGSLQAWLDSDRGWNLGDLDLFQRFDIAYDVAVAIHYLHNETEISIVHCDLKPSNVLLDGDLNARVSDFGISRFLSKDSTTVTCDIKGSFGYIAPECGVGARISKMWDVYSYGILLLEMFTGKSPTDEIFAGDITLHKYVEDNLPEHVLDVADVKLLTSSVDDDVPMDETSLLKIRDSLQEIMRIGLICSNYLPRDRIDMEDVLRNLDNIRRFIFFGNDRRRLNRR